MLEPDATEFLTFLKRSIRDHEALQRKYAAKQWSTDAATQDAIIEELDKVAREFKLILVLRKSLPDEIPDAG